VSTPCSAWASAFSERPRASQNARASTSPAALTHACTKLQGTVLPHAAPGASHNVLHTPQSARFAQGTVLIHSGAELETYSRSEEDRLEALIAGIAASGAKADPPRPRLSPLAACAAAPCARRAA
jgi:hypothetical protein